MLELFHEFSFLVLVEEAEQVGELGELKDRAGAR
jgi:hypothetical protein